MSDTISRQAAIDALKTFENGTKTKSCSKDNDLISRQAAIE